MDNFNFHRPQTLTDAVSALKGADEGKFLGGGQSLIPTLKLELASYSDLISLDGLTELKGIEATANGVVIGAGMTHAAVAKSSVVREAIPALAELASHIGDPQVRNRGTLGGSVAHADPAADYPAAVIALKTTVHTDRRTLSGDTFFTGMFETALEDDEIITKIAFTKPDKAWYAKFENPASKYAVVGVMVAKFGSEVRVGVTGASSHAHRFEAMEKALSASFTPEAVGDLKPDAAGLNEDVSFSAEYRAHLVNVMARRAVERAV